MPGDTLKFIDYRKPKLEAGTYQFTVGQQYGNPNKDLRHQLKPKSLTFKVSGDRIRLNSQQVFAKYPPSGENGNFNDTLPHIALNNATLPWQRSAYRHDSDAKVGDITERYEPWLYLMLINDDDLERGDARALRSCKIAELKQDAYVPEYFYQSLQQDIKDGFIQADEAAFTVDIRAGLFRQLIGDHKEHLQYLAHVRQRHSEQGHLKRELSVIMGNRFAQSNTDKYPTGMANYALLVSLEQYLNDSSGLKDEQRSLYATGTEATGVALKDLDEQAYIRLLVLTHWSFTSKNVKINFEARSKALDVGSLRLPSRHSSAKHAFVTQVANKRDSGTEFDDRLQAGMSAILHEYRFGDRSMSWYRGPCVPYQANQSVADQLTDAEKGRGTDAQGKPYYTATDADKLLGYYEIDGMFDISYAAAYELGRLLALKNNDYAEALYEYKRTRSRYVLLKREDEDRRQDVIVKGITVKQLPYAKLNVGQQQEQLQVIQSFLQQLASLEGIPHWYLIPDPDLLPQRTLRTFQIDPKWIQSLWLGALSLSGRAHITHKIYQELCLQLQSCIPTGGFFLRSDLVWAYPEMVVEAKAVSANTKDGQALDLVKLRQTKRDKYNDYIEGRINTNQAWVQAKGLVRQQQLDSDLLLALVTDYPKGQCVKYKNAYYICQQEHRATGHFAANQWQICAPWATGNAYQPGQWVTHQDRVYQCLKDHTEGGFQPINWQRVEVMDWQPTIQSANYVALYLPAEGLHYGADVKPQSSTPIGYRKDIKYQGNTAATLASLPVDAKGIVDVQALVQDIRQALGASDAVDPAYKKTLKDFGAARLSRYMLEGEPKVEFSCGGQS
tara:strand:- start:2679 stop:5198 length:2520 start_codon:yes stop_codon:yes gene_type:complete